MKSLFSLLLFVFISFYSNAQIVDIPDANFKARLLEASHSENIAYDSDNNRVIIDTNNNGEIEILEALNIFELKLYDQNISDLTGIEAFTNLNHLTCRENNLTLIDITQNLDLITLDISNNQLTSLDLSQNPNMKSLNVSENLLNNLDISLNLNLESIRCNSNNLTILDVSQHLYLRHLNLDFNQISNIDVTQSVNLEMLQCENNNLTTLDITQNFNLEWLACGGNNLTTLDVIQNLNLEYLRCLSNNLTTLDISQNVNLETLICSSNNLTTLDVTQNINLEWLACSNNQLTNIGLLENLNLNKLFFSNNQISNMDFSLFPNLTQFSCDNNLLTELNLSYNNELEWWWCNNNQITYINLKNDGYSFGADNFFGINVANNPIEFICADEEEILAFQELTNYQGPISSYCSFVPGGNYNTIFGDIIFDADNNGCDVSDYDMPYLRVHIDDGISSGSTFSNQSGEYTFFTETGNYQLTPEFENPDFFNSSPLTTAIDFTNINDIANQDFCVTTIGIHNDLEIVVVSTVPAQPGFDTSYQLVYKNKGNQVISGSIDFSYDDSVLDLLSMSEAPAIQNPGSLSWNYTDLNLFESRVIDLVFNVNSPMETPSVNIDDVLDFTATISPISSDETPQDNTFSLKEIVTGSYDPNDITCLEGDVVSPDKIGEYLHYNINFENTGTAAATFVVVKDIIDEANYDISSLQIIHASHEMQTTVADNSIEFVFDNINLGPNEKGNVVFKIKTLNTLTVGNSVSNQAEIFFDYNFPIETNIATTSFQVLSVDEFGIDNSISVFPNPSKGIVTLSSKHKLKSIKVHDAMGRLVFETVTEDLNYMLNVADYANGIYYLKINTEFGQNTERLIKN